MSEVTVTSQQGFTSKYQPYPQYKDSKLVWLGAVPCHWELRKAKYLFKRVQRSVRVEDEIVTAFRDGQVTLRINRRTDGFTNALQEIGYQGVRVGDLLIHAMDGFAGAIGISDSDGKCSPVCSVCIPLFKETVNSHYYGYLIRQLAVTGFIASLSKGIRERSTEFRFSEFSPLELPLPPVEEQQIIAEYLDYETARIDQLIAQQQRLIELLKEKRQAVISHAVTKGLNPNAPMKDSGVEWLGQVPEHWVVTRAKMVSKIFVPQRNKPELNDIGDGTFWATMENMKNDEINAARHFVSSDAAIISGSKVLQKGAVVASCVGNFGVAALLNVDVIINQQLQAYIPKTISGQYLRDLISISKTYFELVGTAATLVYVNQEGFGNMPVTLPPIEEQLEIEKYNNKIKEKFENAIAKGELQVSLLQERRTALISAAVTGKIDLRGWTHLDEEVAA